MDTPTSAMPHRPITHTMASSSRSAAAGDSHPAHESLRVLVVTPRAHPDVGGVESHVLETTRRMARAGLDVTVLTTDRTGEQRKQDIVDGVLIVRARALPKGRDYYFTPELYPRVRSGQWDVVHCQSYHTLVPPLAMLAARRSGVPYVVSFHSGGHDSSMRPLVRRLQHATLRPFLRGASRLICVSEFERARFSRILGLPPEHFEVIPNGCDLPDPGPLTPKVGPLIASIGRLERYKGHHRLIGALPHLLPRFPGARALIVGQGPYRPQLEALANQLGVADAVEFRSVASNDRLGMARVMREAAVVVLLSEYESAGMAVLEAVGLGTPALVLDDTALHELVDAGWARGVPPDADDALVADAIATSVGTRRDPWRPPRVPTWDDCAARLVSVYESVGRSAPEVTPRPAGRIRRDPARPTQAASPGSSERLRVLMVTPRSPLEHGGVERHVMEVSRRLVRAGASVDVLCADARHGVSDRRTEEGILIRSVPSWPVGGDYHLAPRMWQEMSEAPWDLVHVQSYHTFVAPLAMLRALILDIPYVVTFHGGGHSSRMRHALRRVQRRALRPLLTRARRLVAVARFEIELYGRELRLPPERFALIPNGTDMVADALVASDRKADQVVLASIGRLERYKGHQRAIAALPHVLAQRPHTKLVVVGTGPYEAALRRHAAKLGVGDSVEFMSVPADDPERMAQLLRQISLVVLLSDFETQPLVALDAAAAHRRLLVSDRGGLREFAEDGFARAVTPRASPRVVGGAILDELARPEPAEAPRLISWDECATALLELYRTVVREAAASTNSSDAARAATG